MPCVVSPCRTMRSTSSQRVQHEQVETPNLHEKVRSIQAIRDLIVPRDPQLPALPMLPGFTLGYLLRRRQMGDGLQVKRNDYRTDPHGSDRLCAL